MINAVWIDDLCDDHRLSGIRRGFEDNDIDVKAFTNSKDGIDYIRNHADSIDAIVLDVIFFEKPSNELEQTFGTDDDKAGFYNVKDYLQSIKNTHPIPIFILTGQEGLKIDGSFKQSCGKIPIYHKGDGVQKLIDDLIKEVSQSKKFKVRQRYSDVFGSLDHFEDTLGNDIKEDLTSILVPLLYPDESEPVDYFNNIRIATENVLRQLNRYGIIPDECFPRDSTSNELCKIFIQNHFVSKLGIQIGERYQFPDWVNYNLTSLLSMTNLYSHSAPVEKAEITKKGRTFRNIAAIALQLCEVINWIDSLKEKDYYKNIGHIWRCINWDKDMHVFYNGNTLIETNATNLDNNPYPLSDFRDNDDPETNFRYPYKASYIEA